MLAVHNGSFAAPSGETASCAGELRTGAKLFVEQRYAEAAVVLRGVANRLHPGEVYVFHLVSDGDGGDALITYLSSRLPRADGGDGGGRALMSRLQALKPSSRGAQGAHDRLFSRTKVLDLVREARFKHALSYLQHDPAATSNLRAAAAVASSEAGGESPMSASQFTRSSGRFRRQSDLPGDVVGESLVDLDPSQLDAVVERENEAWLELVDNWPTAASRFNAAGELRSKAARAADDAVVVRGETVTRLDAAQTACTWWKRSRRKLAVACRAKANALPFDSLEARELYTQSLTFDPSSETNAQSWNNVATALRDADDYVQVGDASYNRLECFLNALENLDLQARAEVWANALKSFGAEPRNVPRYGHVSRDELARLLIAPPVKLPSSSGAAASTSPAEDQPPTLAVGHGTHSSALATTGIFSAPADVTVIRSALDSATAKSGGGSASTSPAAGASSVRGFMSRFRPQTSK